MTNDYAKCYLRHYIEHYADKCTALLLEYKETKKTLKHHKKMLQLLEKHPDSVKVIFLSGQPIPEIKIEV